MLDSPVLALAQATSTGGAPACQSGSSGGRVTLWCLVPRSTRPGRLIPLPWRRRAAAPARRGKDDAMVHGSLLSLKSAADPARTSPIRRLKEAYGGGRYFKYRPPPAPGRCERLATLRLRGRPLPGSCPRGAARRPAVARRHGELVQLLRLGVLQAPPLRAVASAPPGQTAGEPEPPRVGVHHRRRRRVSACHRS